MSLGTQYGSAKGFHEFEKSLIYHKLINDSKTETIVLVAFKDAETKPDYVLVRMMRSTFEQGIDRHMIERCELQSALPVWVGASNETELRQRDAKRRRGKNFREHDSRAERKVAYLAEAVSVHREILLSDDPEKVLNSFANACSPPIKAKRFRFEFFVYLAFGKRSEALRYKTFRIGRYDRRSNLSTVKRGAPNKVKGKGYGHNANPDMIQLILDSYEKLRTASIGKDETYIRALVEFFKCKARKVDGFIEYYHPRGKHFPSDNEYWYYVEDAHGPIEVRTTRLGSKKEKSKFTPYRGKNTSNVSNIMERVDEDGYVMDEAPRGFLEGSHLRPLTIVRMRDVASGEFVGIGGSLDGESASAYRMARFCAAIDKVKFCSLFGMKIPKTRWPGSGVPPYEFTDRGTGSLEIGYSRDPEFTPAIIGTAPAGSPQTKALIEASNPRKQSSRESTPTHVVGTKNVCELFKEAIELLLQSNEAMNVQDRIPLELLERVRPPTANVLYEVLDGLERNDAVPMTFDEAVRAFLRPVPATMNRDGVVVSGRVFGSRAFDATGFRNQISGAQELRVEVHFLDLCLRHIWIDVHGKIVELDMEVAFRANDEELHLSLEELKAWAKFVSQSKRPLRAHKLAAKGQARIDYEKQTGERMGSNRRVKGRAPRNSKQAIRENAEAKRLVTGQPLK